MMATTNQREIGPAAAFLRLVLLSAAATAAVLAIGYWPTRNLSGADGVTAMLLGAGVALLAAVAGLTPSVALWRAGPRERLGGLLLGAAVRFLITLGLLVALLLGTGTHRVALVAWAGITYLVLLAVDSAGVAWLHRRTSKETS